MSYRIISMNTYRVNREDEPDTITLVIEKDSKRYTIDGERTMSYGGILSTKDLLDLLESLPIQGKKIALWATSKNTQQRYAVAEVLVKAVFEYKPE